MHTQPLPSEWTSSLSPFSFDDVSRDASDWIESATEALEGDGRDLGVLLHDLDGLRRRTPDLLWRNHVVRRIRCHTLYDLALECPFSRRATDKPRGYAGDPITLDFWYGRASVAPLLEAASERGRRLCAHWWASPAAVAVRARRDFVRARLEARARRGDPGSVLAVGCGHLVEALDSPLVRGGAFRRFVAVDHDDSSLEHVARYGAFEGLELVQDSVQGILRPPASDERFDLVYSTGLFDVLPDRFARLLARRLFERLAPGGELVISSFLERTPNIAAMDVFQDWRMFFRTRDEIERWAGFVDGSALHRARYTETRDGCVGLLILERARGPVASRDSRADTRREQEAPSARSGPPGAPASGGGAAEERERSGPEGL